eukprot:1886606-Pleurochrysis_carterae.AAC.6
MRVSAEALAAALLRLGTIVFMACAVLLHADMLTHEMQHLTVYILLTHSALVMSFIGGLHQAAAVAQHAPVVMVASGIGGSLVGWGALFLKHLEASSGSSSGTPLQIMGTAYACQAFFEAQLVRKGLVSYAGQQLMMTESRRLPMWIAAGGLATASLVYIDGRQNGVASSVLLPAILFLAGCDLLGAFLHRPKARFRRVVVGTLNPTKLSAVRFSLSSYKEVASAATVIGYAVPSGVEEQPMTLEETSRGAKQRAEAAYAASGGHARTLAFGIESGLLPLAGDHFDVCVVSAYDGAAHHIGMSCAFQIPPRILKLVLEQKLDLSQACKAAQITTSNQLGAGKGLIGILSRDRVNRCEYTSQAIRCALFFAENYPGSAIAGGDCGSAFPMGPLEGNGGFARPLGGMQR